MSALELLIGWLAPPLCINCSAEGSVLCVACSTSEIIPFGARCWKCESLSVNGRTCERCRSSGSPTHMWITTDYSGASKELIQKFKFGHQRAGATVVAELMVETFLNFSSDEQIKRLNYLIVPIPTATSRVRERGFDHAALLSDAVSRKLSLDKCDVLGRRGQSRQVGATRSARLAQAKSNYHVRKPDRVSGRNVLLVDDVVTTGATLSVASHILRKAGAGRVDSLVFAKRR